MSKKQFKAESKRLLDLMINSIYTHKEIFLREIISNASDAIDKLSYRALTDDQVGMNREDFRILVAMDESARTITVSDNGIGMTRDELEQNLGVIAKSGSMAFKGGIDGTTEEGAQVDIIGQFGVGFYSAFMVSDKVTVISRAYGSDQAYKWESEGADGYTITECEKEGVGTDVIMHIKPDDENEKYSDFLQLWKLMRLIKKYSDYIRWPIQMDVQRPEYKETGEKNEDGTPKYETVNKTERETVNSMVPIWQRSKSEVSDEDCMNFYKEKFHDTTDPAAVIRVNAEGQVSYKALLFIPGRQLHRLSAEPVGVGHGAVDAASCVAGQLTQGHIRLKDPSQLSRRAGLPLVHAGDGGRENAAAVQRHEQGGVHVVDAVAQGPEGAGLGAVEGDGTDARHGVPNPGPQLILPIRRAQHCLGGQLHLLVVPNGSDAHGLPLQLLQEGGDLLNGVHLRGVDVGDDVPLPQPAGLGRVHRSLLGGDF